MEQLLKANLHTTTLKSFGRSGGGCINDGQGYETDFERIFVKKNEKADAKQMFDGEYRSLAELYATDLVKVPKPIKVIENPTGGAVFVAEYVEMQSGVRHFAKDLGKRMARLHAYNGELLKRAKNESGFIRKEKDSFTVTAVSRFGFHETTCCGYLPLDNSWNDDWVDFYCRQRLKPQIDRIVNDCDDRQIGDLWNQLERKIPQFFSGIRGEIVPALLHGDLWSGNVGETENEPVIFDPASFYGHSEFEFGIATMFGGFPSAFHNGYHEILPKAPGFEKRLELYQLFHYLNHWSHFGEGYKNSSLSLMKKLCQT